MNQERGQGTFFSSRPLIAIHVQVWGFLYHPATKYKTILKLLISFYYSVDVYTFQNLHFKSHAITLTNERQLLIWKQLWQDVLSSKQASRAESKDQQSKLDLYNKRQFVTACGYCFGFVEYIAIKRNENCRKPDRNSDCLSIKILSLL